MRIDFPYPGYEGIAPVDVPGRNLLGVFAPRVLEPSDPDDLIARAIAHPIGAPPLRDAVRRDARVLVLVDDATRGTPVARVMPHVARELETAGVPDWQITVLTAQGTHRRMSEAELRRKLGSLYDRFTVRQHDWLDEAGLHDFGCLADGTRVTANRLLTQSDFVLGIGSIVPHRIKGFSGGAKIAFPGVAGPEIQARNQADATAHCSEEVMGTADNPMRHRIEDAARRVGLRYIVNCVADGAGRLAGCFAGDPIRAHRAGCELSRELNAVRLPTRADIVIIDSHPADRDVWQSAKAVYSGTMAVRDGGTLIIIAPNPEGVAEQHPVMLETGFRPAAELARQIAGAAARDAVGLAVLSDIVQVMERAACVLVSPGVPEAQAQRLGFTPAPSAQQALQLALARHGPAASIAVLRRGGHILPHA